MGKDNKYSKETISSRTTLVAYGTAIILLFLLGVYVDRLEYTMPKALSKEAAPELFSEGRAWNYLIATQDVGMSMAGTKANDRVAKIIYDELIAVKTDADKRRSAATNPETIAQVEVIYQNPSGAMDFHFMHSILTNVYTNLTNVLVRLSWGEASKKDAILVNSHFDTPVESPGATDDRSCVAMMLELARAASYHKMDHALILLFNGAEESLQEGSHGFITQHEWAKTVRTIVNFDAAGSGGPELLFQAGSIEFPMIYATSAPRPHGSVVATDIFGTGVISSDTDYRIFRDYGNITGLDFAFYKNGYWYHTDRDSIENLSQGSIQHEGDNALAYILALDKSGVLDKPIAYPPTHKAVYYTLGKIMLAYSDTTARIVNYSVAGLAILVVLSASTNYAVLLFSSMATLGGLIVGTLASISVASFMAFVLRNKLTWYTHQLFSIPLYAVPSALAIIGLQYFVLAKRWNIAEKQRVAIAHSGTILAFAALTVLATAASLGSAYLFLWPTAIFTVVHLLSRFVTNGELNWLMISAEAALPALLYFQVSLPAINMFIPLVGRTGAEAPSDLIIAGLVGFLTALFLKLLVPMVHKSGNQKIVIRVGLAILIAAICVSFIMPVYERLTPRRIALQHTYRFNPSHNNKHPALDDGPGLLIGVTDNSDDTELLAILGAKFPNQIRRHVDGFDWISVYPVSQFLSGYVVPAPPLQDIVTPPSLKVTVDEFSKSTNIRRLVLQMSYGKNEWSTLKFSAPLVKWNLTDPIPPIEKGYYMCRHVGKAVENRNTWAVELLIEGKETIDFDLQTTHFVHSPFIEEVAALFPEHYTLTSWTSALMSLSV